MKPKRGFIFTLFILLFVFTSLPAQWVKTKGLYGGYISSFASIGNTIFAGTISGVYVSSDNGLSWSPRSNGLTNLLVNKLYAAGTQIYAGTGNGLFVSSDNGTNWHEIDNGIMNKDIRSILVQGNLIIAGTAQKGILLSSDSGSNWSQIADLQNLNVLAIAKMGETIYAGTGVAVCRSTDNGVNWNWPQTRFSNVWSIAVLGTKIFASTIDTGIYCSTDGGDTWFQTNTGLPDMEIQSIIAAGTNLYAGTGQGVYVSTDEGANWLKAGDTGKGQYAFNLFNMGNNLLAGTSGGVFISSDCGVNWNQRNTGLTSTTVVSIVSADNYLFAGTQGNGLMASTDSGNNWFQCNNGLNQSYVFSLAVIGKHIFALGEDDIFVSTNYGNSWAKTNVQFDYTGAPLMAEGNNLFAESLTGIFLTSDFGETWTPLNSKIDGKDILHFFRSGNCILATTGNWDYYISTDNGNNWNAIAYLTTNKKSVSSFLVSDSNIFIGTNLGIIVSNDNGISWLSPVTKLSSSHIPVLAASGKNLFAGTNENGVFVSTDSGLNWEQINTGLTETNLNSLIIAGGYIFAGTYGGTWKRPLAEIATTVEKQTTELPVKYALSQNYPNPFNPTTTISYTVPSGSFVSLKVLDVLGREVALLVNEEKSPGSYKAVFNANGLASGIYFYHLQADKFSETKKLILLK